MQNPSLVFSELTQNRMNCFCSCSNSVVCCQVVLLSATMPADVLEVTTKFMREPIRILVKKEELTLEGIKQFYINVEREVRNRFSLFNVSLPSFKSTMLKSPAQGLLVLLWCSC